MPLSPQKKVGIIIIALLLLGAVALVQTGKIQIPGLKSDALNTGNCTGTLPTNAILQPADADSGDHVWHMDGGAGPYSSCAFKCPDGYAYKNNACTLYTDVPHIYGVQVFLENYTNNTPVKTYVHYMIQGTGFGIGGTVTIDGNSPMNTDSIHSGFGHYTYLQNHQPILSINPSGTVADPFGVAGHHTLTITNANGTSNLFPFDIPNAVVSTTKPYIYLIAPSYGKIGDKFSVRGINFSPFTPNNKVIFGSSTGNIELSPDSNGYFTIPDVMSNGRAVVPFGYPIKVRNENGTESDLVDNGITVIGPQIDTIGSSFGQPGTQVTIQGSGFASTNTLHLSRNAMTENTVSIDNNQLTITENTASTDGNQLTFTVPTNITPDNYILYVENSNGRSNIVPFTILPKVSISSITPDHGPIGTTVTIQGEGFSDDDHANNTFVKFGTVTIDGISSHHGTTLTFTVPQELVGPCDGTVCTRTTTVPGSYNIQAQNASGNNSNVVPFTVISTPTTPPPQAHISVGGSNNATAKVGDKVTYAWSAMDATSATSTYTASPSRCGAGGAWLANTTSGSLTSDPLPASYAGCTFTIKYKSKNTAGTTAEDTLVLTIQGPAEPTATLKVNGSTGSVTARVGDRVRYEWSSDNAATATSTYTTNKASCGAGGAWIIKKPNGAIVAPALPASYAGCVFTLNFTVNQASTGKKATSTVVMTIQ